MLEALVVLAVGFGLLLLLPLLLLKLFLGLAFGLVVLPYKLLGSLFHAGFAVVGGLAKLLAGGAAVVLGLFGVVLVVACLPLLPIIALGFFVYLIFRIF
jgi:hypothetical protein